MNENLMIQMVLENKKSVILAMMHTRLDFLRLISKKDLEKSTDELQSLGVSQMSTMSLEYKKKLLDLGVKWDSEMHQNDFVIKIIESCYIALPLQKIFAQWYEIHQQLLVLNFILFELKAQSTEAK